MAYSDQSLQRKQEIEEGLLELMLQMPYERITVKDLTDSLRIARKTFYHYFPNKRSCLESLTDRLIYSCNLDVIHLSYTDNSEQVYTARMNFWIKHKRFLDAVNRNGLGDFFLDRVLAYVHREEQTAKELLSTPEVPCDEDILFFYMSGQVNLLLKWCNDGFCIPVEEMVLKNMRLLHEPLIQPDRR